jgi:hypothetical protein
MNRWYKILMDSYSDLCTVCVFDNFRLTFKFNSKLSHDVPKTIMNINWHLHFSFKLLFECHMFSSTCHFIFLQVHWHVVFPSQVTLYVTFLIVCVNWRAFFILFLGAILHVKCQKLAKAWSNISVLSALFHCCIKMDNHEIMKSCWTTRHTRHQHPNRA